MANLDNLNRALSFIRANLVPLTNKKSASRLRWSNGMVYHWNGTTYEELPEQLLRGMILRWLTSPDAKQAGLDADTSNILQHVYANVTAQLMRNNVQERTWIDPETQHERFDDWLSFTNGVLNLSTIRRGEQVAFVKPTPRWFSTMYIPYDYNSKAVCPLFERCVAEWMEDDKDRIRVLQEYAGYCFSTDTSFEAALFLQGLGGNGKGAFCEALQAALGEENYSAVSIAKLGDKFAPADTMGKLVNFTPETTLNRKLPVEDLKGLITGDKTTFEIKYKAGVTARPTAKLIVSWNDPPEIKDPTNAWWRRMLLIPWNRSFSEEERDVTLKHRLAAEAPGIFNWAMTGLARLHQQQHFSKSATIADALQEFRSMSNSAEAFVAERIRSAPMGRVFKDLLYAKYESFCEQEDMPIEKPQALGRAIKKQFDHVTTSKDERNDGTGRGNVFVGIHYVST